MREKRIKFGDIIINDTAKALVNDCLESNWTTMGEKTKLFEKEVEKLFECKFASAVSSGTDALICSLMSLYDYGAVRGSEVIIPALSFISTCSAVLAAGFTPVLVDVKSDLLIDEEKIKEKLSSKTVAVIPVTLMGSVPNMPRIIEIVRKFNPNIVTIVDNCEGHLCKYNNRYMEYYGDLCAYSCFTAHCLNSGTEMGIVTTLYRELDSAIKSIRSHGRKNGDLYFNFIRYGLNCKPTDIDASLGIGALLELKDNFRIRKNNLNYIKDVVRPYSQFVWFNSEEPNTESSPHAFNISLRQPSKLIFKLQKALDDANIEWKKTFGAYHTHQGYRALGQRGDFPMAEHLGDYSLHFACHQYLTEEDLIHIKNTLINFCEREF